MNVAYQALSWLEAHETELIRTLADLIIRRSENLPPVGDEKPVQLYLKQQLDALDFSTELYSLTEVNGLAEHPQYWPGRDYTDRPNLVAVKKGAGGGQSLLFAVHADVVPGVAGRHAPFEPVALNGRVYGRGSNDMKGGIAAILLAFRYLKEHGIRLRGNVILESVVDEEMGGANGTLAGRLRGSRADAAIVPEPTNLRVCTSHTGGVTWRITVQGKGGMGFGGEEVTNPIYAIAHMVSEIERYAAEVREAKVFRTPSGAVTTPNVVLSMIHAGSFDPGMADGVPESSFIEVWVECMPGESLADMEREFKLRMERVIHQSDEHGKLNVKWEQITRFLYGSEAKTSLTDLLLPLASEITGLPMEAHMAPFACDAFMFNQFSDTPAIILGPVGENAHAADEYVEVNSLLQLACIYIETMLSWCGIAEDDSNGGVMHGESL
ncbi:M20 family metallopeptidase [Paenibacillus sp. OV219]|uniref:M20 family metallopeptidase n=1 Tax=Paenibacillus sp. OV219 TaxID=1884377 RepID=UPI0008B10191|nr:M20/M25/M40 family metallo-hydrolase [Paenibacillus sp. OV219]SEO05333.1 acetylornithine deacetylase [Paenibacillus sp. OV219]